MLGVTLPAPHQLKQPERDRRFRCRNLAGWDSPVVRHVAIWRHLDFNMTHRPVQSWVFSLECCAAQFGKYLEEKARPEWRDNYLDYKALKDLIKESANEDAAVSAPSGGVTC